MKIGLVGIGRMGFVLAGKLAPYAELWLFDQHGGQIQAAKENFNVKIADNLDQIADTGLVILAVPAQQVVSCIKEFNRRERPLIVINIATSVAQRILSETALPHVRCISVKFIAHAGEMALGAKPVIIVNDEPPELVETALTIFSQIGAVIVGRADTVSSINSVAAGAALAAAVQIEENLRLQGITDRLIVESAIRQVAAGVMKGYANNDLGPFARDIVHTLKAKLPL